MYDDPVYNVYDSDDDGEIDNPGEVLYYMPTRTNQTDNYSLGLGLSATWSRPLDKELQELCKAAATTQTELNAQLPYHKVCADVVLINPVGHVGQHTHTLTTNEVKVEPPKTEVRANGKAEDLGTFQIGNFKD
jgi:hypothetical protein